MIVPRLHAQLAGVVAVILGVTALVSTAPMTIAQSSATPGADSHQTLLAQPAQLQSRTLEPGQLGARVTDTSGVLSPEQAVELEDSLNQIVADRHRSVFIVFMPSFGEYGNMEWSELAARANGGGNTLVLAVATEDRQYGLTADVSAGYWSNSELDVIDSAIFPSLVASNWAGVGYAAVDEVRATVPEVAGDPPVVQSSSHLIDATGALDPSQFAELERLLEQFRIDHDRHLYFGYVPSLEHEETTTWLNELDQTADPSFLTVAWFTETNQYGVYGNTESGPWNDAQIDYVKNELTSAPNEDGYFGSGVAIIEAAGVSIEMSGEPAPQQEPRSVRPAPAREESSSGSFLFLPLVLLVLALGALVYFLKLRRTGSGKKREEKLHTELARARSLTPQDRLDIEQLSIDVLEARTHEVLLETDDALTTATAELEPAEAEFGSLRMHDLKQAIADAEAALRQGRLTQEEIEEVSASEKGKSSPLPIWFNNAIHRTLVDLQKRQALASVTSQQATSLTALVQKKHQEWLDLAIKKFDENPQTRAMRVDIITSCGRAHGSLTKELEALAQIRRELANAEATLSELTMRSVGLHTRFTAAEKTLEGLRSRYAPAVLTSVDDNIELAGVALGEADRQMEGAREQLAMRVGKQGGLVDALRATERALDQSDGYLVEVEHADNNIRTARTGLRTLTKKVREEIAEAGQLRQRGFQSRAKADWDALDQEVGLATAAAENADAVGEQDPLGAYRTLLDAETRLEKQLESVRETVDARSRELMALDTRIGQVRGQIQQADDFITANADVVRARAFIYLRSAQELAKRAQELRVSDTRSATQQVQRSATEVTLAVQQAEKDLAADLARKEEEERMEKEKLETNKRRGAGLGFASFSGSSSYDYDSSSSNRSDSSSSSSSRSSNDSGYSSRGGSF